ncbi:MULTISPECIES: helix-turn-helix domain-containing protein [unclassified Spirosoma]|uniref:helix-turn-helix domain-containing protein n=1 Tax=unclassified Spirosoma TaxID=2621999 RepID=UPI00095BE5A1|nr:MULTISPECIES: helix-turn-helix domain-containing protein [unclassified Spirosoma]OJW80679.1 MAG: AraC family transcriptional regulator [Spirosoma sp. 48-14]
MVFRPRIPPHPALRPYVRHYLLLHVQMHGVPLNQRIKPIPPDADQSLFFYPRSSVNAIINSTAESRTSAASIFVGQQTSRINIQFGDDHLIIQVCFQPGFLYKLLGKIPINSFQNEEMNAEYLTDTGMKDLNEQLREETDYGRMIGRIEAYLLKKLARLRPEILPIDKVILALKDTHQPLSLDWLADQACLSPRQLERKFQERMGVSPKFYARIARFDRAFKLKQQQPQLDWHDVAYTCGYFDYSHMMRDFRQFAEVPPSMLLAQDMASPDWGNRFS